MITFNNIKQKYDTVPSYPVSDEFIEVPAGWLIEKCGWKGKQVGNCGVHADQALVLVNFGNAIGAEIANLALQIQQSVLDNFCVKLEFEVNII